MLRDSETRIQLDYNSTYHSSMIMILPWRSSKTYTVTFCSNCFLKCSHAVLSVIFGILGKFPIGIGIQIFFIESFFRRKKSKTILVEKKSWLKNMFWIDFMSSAPAQTSRRGENHQKTMEIHRKSSKIMFFSLTSFEPFSIATWS